MPYQEIDDFTSGQILTTAVMNTLRDNVEENRDRQVGSARAYVAASSFGEVGELPTASFSESAVLSATLEFHGRPVLLIFTGNISWKNAGRNHELAYKIDGGNIIQFTENRNTAGNVVVESSSASPPLILTDISAGEHTISIFLSDTISGSTRTWRNPGMLVWELPFDNFD